MSKHKRYKIVFVQKILRQVMVSQTDLAVLTYMMMMIAARPDVRSSESARAKICRNYTFHL
jgi:hypothetical protein